MAIFGIPTYAEIREEAIAVYKALRPDASVAEGSDLDVKSTTWAHLVHGLHMTLWYGLLFNILPTKSSGWVLDAWLWFFGLSDGQGGFGRIQARGSSADDGFTFVADAGPYSNLSGESFTDSAGNIYRITESYTPTGPGVTPALDVEARSWPIDNGAATNIEVTAGETYTWESQPSYMTSTITQVVDLDGGANKETDSEGRARLAEHLQDPPGGGNWSHWKEVAEEAEPGTVDAYVWEGFHNDVHGFGATDLACLQRVTTVAAGPDAKELESTDDLYDTIDQALLDNIMYGALFRMRFLDSNADVQDVEVVITLKPDADETNKCDWDAFVPRFTVSSHSEVNKTITANADVTAYILVGSRVVIYGAQAVVSKVGVAGGLGSNLKFEVQTWFDVYDADDNPYPWYDGYPVTPGHHIYSGGGLILDCVGALRDTTFGRLGPGKGSAGTSAPIQGWEDTLRLQQIQADLIAVGDAAGNGLIIDVDPTVPATDTVPTTGTDTDVYFLEYDEIVVWENKS
jgi:hypothetical protein